MNQQMRVYTKAGVERGDQVLRRNGVGSGKGGDLVRRTVHVTAAHAPSGKDNAKTLGPVIASSLLVETRRSPKLSHHHHQRLVQQTSVGEVLE
jgi:hypothetical protein